MDDRPRILIADGGYGGMQTALRQEKLLRGRGDGDGRRPALVHDLPAAARRGGRRQPGTGHVVVPLRAVLRRTQVIKAAVSSIDHPCRVRSAQDRRAALTFVFAGGGYARVEALAEPQDMAFEACACYTELSHREMRWILVEAADRILPEVSPAMAGYTAALLRRGTSRSGWAPGWPSPKAAGYGSMTARSSPPGPWC